MAAKYFTRGIGLIYVLLGVCAFVPQLNGPTGAELMSDQHITLHFENLFKQLPMNYGLAVLLIILGGVAVWGSATVDRARKLNRVMFLGAIGLAIIGVCPHPISTVFGLVPLYGWMVGLDIAVALFTFYFAFIDGVTPASSPTPVFRQ